MLNSSKTIDHEICLTHDWLARDEPGERGELTRDAPHPEIGRAVADDQHRTFELELARAASSCRRMW